MPSGAPYIRRAVRRKTDFSISLDRCILSGLYKSAIAACWPIQLVSGNVRDSLTAVHAVDYYEITVQYNVVCVSANSKGIRDLDGRIQ